MWFLGLLWVSYCLIAVVLNRVEKKVNRAKSGSSSQLRSKAIIPVLKNLKSAEKNKTVVLETSIIKPSPWEQKSNIPKYVSRHIRYKCPLNRCLFSGEDMYELKDHITGHRIHNFCFICPHCKPIVFKANSVHEMGLHLNFHGSDLYICQYCEYIHYKPTKVEGHQRSKHPSRIDGKNKCNILVVRKQYPIRKTVYPVVINKQTAEWVCNVCISGIKYTKTAIAEHLSMVHNITNMFICAMCQFDHSDYVAFEEHFKSNHRSLPIKYLTVHFNKVSPNVEFQPGNKQTNVDEPTTSTQHYNMLNVPETLDGVAEPTPEIPAQEILIEPTLPISAESVGVLEDQEKVLDNPSGKPEDYLKLMEIYSSMGKYVCPVCNVFVTEEKESFREHMLKEMNDTLWKCLECLTICDSKEKIETHVIKHKQGNQKYEKIESFKKYDVVDGIIEYQKVLIDNEMFRKDNQPTDCDDQNGTKVFKAMTSLFNHIAHKVAVAIYGFMTASLL